MRCARGTWCKDSKGPWISPCSLTKPPRANRHLLETCEGGCAPGSICLDGVTCAVPV